GNSINWMAGHILTARQALLKGFNVAAFLSDESRTAYARGSKPGEQMPERLADLREMLTRSHDALLEVLARLDETALDAKAPFSPTRRRSPFQNHGRAASAPGSPSPAATPTRRTSTCRTRRSSIRRRGSSSKRTRFTSAARRTA